MVAPAPAPAPAEAVDDSARGELVSAPPTLAVSVGGTRLDLPVWGSTVSEAVAHWCVALGLPADMEGRLTGWYRLQQAGIPVKGDASVDQLDHEIDAELVFVPNTRVMVTVEVAGEPPTRFRTFVGMAVPARAIVGQLRGLLELPEADWALWADGLQLGPDQTLGEAAPEVSVISVRC